MKHSAKKVPQTFSSGRPKSVTPARGRQPYSPPQLIVWGTLLDLTQGAVGAQNDFVGGSQGV